VATGECRPVGIPVRRAIIRAGPVPAAVCPYRKRSVCAVFRWPTDRNRISHSSSSSNSSNVVVAVTISRRYRYRRRNTINSNSISNPWRYADIRRKRIIITT